MIDCIVKSFSYFFLITMFFIRGVLNSIFKATSSVYNSSNSSILKNFLFLIFSGLIFTILGYYLNNPQIILYGGPTWILNIVILIISFFGMISLIGGIFVFFLPVLRMFWKRNGRKEFPEEYKINLKLLDIFLDMSGSNAFLNVMINIILMLPLCLITTIFSLCSAIIGNILALVYAIIIIPFRMIFEPLSNILELSDIIKSHGDLLTILFCLGVIGASGESLDKITTGIMSLILVVIIVIKSLVGIKNNI